VVREPCNKEVAFLANRTIPVLTTFDWFGLYFTARDLISQLREVRKEAETWSSLDDVGAILFPTDLKDGIQAMVRLNTAVCDVCGSAAETKNEVQALADAYFNLHRNVVGSLPLGKFGPGTELLVDGVVGLALKNFDNYAKIIVGSVMTGDEMHKAAVSGARSLVQGIIDFVGGVIDFFTDDSAGCADVFHAATDAIRRQGHAVWKEQGKAADV